MLPGSVPSDFDYDQVTSEQLGGRYDILTDLYAQFQGAALGYALLGVLVPGLFIASAYFGWTDTDPTIQVLIGAVLFVAMMAVSLYAWAWFAWVNRRLKTIQKRWASIDAAELERQRQSRLAQHR